jgi:hypothetical protein
MYHASETPTILRAFKAEKQCAHSRIPNSSVVASNQRAGSAMKLGAKNGMGNDAEIGKIESGTLIISASTRLYVLVYI